MTARMLFRLPADRRTALLHRIRERLHELEAMDRSLAHLGEAITPDDVLSEIVAMLEDACPKSQRRIVAA